MLQYLTKNGISNLTKDNFSYRSRWLVGEFIEPSEQGRGREHMILSESEIINRIDELKRFKRRRNIVGASSSRGRKQRESTENEASTSHNQKMSGRFPHELSHQDLMNLATGSRHGFDELRILEMLQVISSLCCLINYLRDCVFFGPIATGYEAAAKSREQRQTKRK